jgi:hypothetical protein
MVKTLFLVLLPLIGALGQTDENQAFIHFYSDSREIDQSYLHQEIKFVHYVRERFEADVHLLVTTQNTGGQGKAYTLTFIGQNRFPGVNDTLSFMMPSSSTLEAVRAKMIRMIKLGLVTYIKKMPVAKDLDLVYESTADGRDLKLEDKWNNWVFSFDMNAHADGEQAAMQMNLETAFKIMRVTDKWKSRFSIEGAYDEERYDYEELHSASFSRSRGVELDVVRSLSDHWSLGASGRYSSSTYNNIEKRFFIEPKVEYNFFPYSRSTREQLRLGYGVQPRYQEYFEQTIYEKSRELLIQHAVELDMDVVKAWGNINLGMEVSQYLHDLEKNSLDFYGRVSLKLVRGISLNLRGSLSMQRDQLSLPQRGVTMEEVLLQRRELASQYSYFSMVGFTYSFGALYNDIVNPRFGNWW